MRSFRHYCRFPYLKNIILSKSSFFVYSPGKSFASHAMRILNGLKKCPVRPFKTKAFVTHTGCFPYIEEIDFL